MIADAFRSLPRAPARSILFIAVTGEETGLLGSDYFAHHPTVPIGDVVANVNIEAPALWASVKDIIGFGAEHSTLGKVLNTEAARLGLSVSPDPNPAQRFFTRSDQYSFVRRGVPALFLMPGRQAAEPAVDAGRLMEQWLATRYHRPSDDMNQPMNLEAAIPMIQLQFLVGHSVASDSDRPTWNAGDFFGETFGRK
jgi:Zn-dependent M28 family amino/carboxypeptidase